MRVGAVAVPALERRRLALPEAQWRHHRIDQHRDIDAALLRPRRLLADEPAFGPDRPFAPHDDDGFRFVELPFDGFAPGVADADMLVPPDGKALGLQRLDQRLHAAAILGLIRDKDVRHPEPPPPRSIFAPAVLTAWAVSRS